MGNEMQEKTIGGIRFKLAHLPAWTAFSAFHRFLAIAGPLAPSLPLIFGAVKAGKLGKLNLGKLNFGDSEQMKVLAALVHHLPAALKNASPDEVKELAQQLLEPCLVVGPKGELQRFNDVSDALLVGKLPVLLQLVGWAVYVHFLSFFVSAGNGAPGALEEQSPSSSPKT